MTVDAVAIRIDHPYATPGQTVFTYPFECWEDTDVVAYTYDATNGLVLATQGAGTSAIPNLQYLVDRVAKTVTLGAALPVDTTLTIMRLLPLTQGTSITNQGTFLASVHEQEFDRLEMKLQEIQEQVNRAAVLPANTPNPISAHPLAAGHLVATDADGTGFELVAPRSTIQTVAILAGAPNPYAVPAGVDVVVVNAGERLSVVLPDAHLNMGRIIRVMNRFNSSIVISAAGSSPYNRLNGDTSVTYSTNYIAGTFLATATGWLIF